MGSSNRDYYREASDRGLFNGEMASIGPVTRRLLIAMVSVFLLQVLWRDTVNVGGRSFLGGSVIESWIELDRPSVAGGQLWRLVTYGFAHSTGNILHLIFNGLGVFFFGRAIESMYGSREYGCFFFASLIVAGLGYLLSSAFLGSMGPVVGASGAVLALLCLYACHFPREEILIFFIFRIELRYFVVLYAIIDSFPLIEQLRGGSAMSNVAHAAHLLGLAFGYLYYKWQGRISDWFSSEFWAQWPRYWRRLRTRRTLRVVSPETLPSEPADPLDEQVDEILAKISAQGEASLSSRERDLLAQASRKYRSRR